jgi:DNA polymerase-3 subunit beta
VQFNGDPVEVGVNATYLIEELRLAHSEEILLKFNNPLGAIVVEPATEDPDHFFIVMPLRIVKEPG